MKICCIADLHVGVKSYSQVDAESHFYERELEILNNFKKIIDLCLNQQIPILIIAGDLYHNAKPSPNLQDEVNKLIYYASKNKLYVLILDGNHDLAKQEDSVSVLKTVNTFQISYVIQTSKLLDKEIVINDETVRFIFLPTYTNNEQIKELLDQNLYEGNDYIKPVIVIGHFTTQGAQLNDWLIAENEEHIDINLFNNRNISFVVLGHLHKPQILKKEQPCIFYTGSLQRTDFNEEDQEKGYWLIDTKTNDLQFFPIKTQTFYTIKVDVDENTNIRNLIDEKRIKDSIVRVILNVPEALKLTVDEEKQLIDYINGFNPYKLLAIKQNIISQKRIRNVAFNEILSINQALEIFYQNQTRGKERIKLGKEIYKKYMGTG